MLKNKGADIEIKYNGIEKLVRAGDLLDVRDFDISTGQLTPQKEAVRVVEREILRKYPGQFEVTEHTDSVQIDKQYRDEIDSIRKELAASKEALEKEHEAGKSNAQKVAELAGQVNSFGEIEKGYKDQISALKAKLKETEEDHEVQIKRLMGGKSK